MTRILMIAQEVANDLADAEAEIIQQKPLNMPEDLASPAYWSLADLAVLAAGQKAEQEGYDAVCVGDAGDFGANALRSLIDIPVIASGRASMLYALTLGSRFAVLSRETLAHRMKKQVQEFALTSQCCGVECVGEHLKGADLVSVACESDLLGRADTVVLAGGFSTQDAQTLQDALGRQVIEPAPLSVKLALGFLGLGLSQSRRSAPKPQDPKPDLIDALARSQRV